MRLTVHTDYAFRVLMYLGTHEDRLCTIQEIAESYKISKNHLMKVVQALGAAGFVETVRGRGGGLRLAMAPEQIQLGAVARSAEEDFRLVECFATETDRCVISQACRLKKILTEAMRAFLATLDAYALSDLIGRKAQLRGLLALTDTDQGA